MHHHCDLTRFRYRDQGHGFGAVHGVRRGDGGGDDGIDRKERLHALQRWLRIRIGGRDVHTVRGGDACQRRDVH